MSLLHLFGVLFAVNLLTVGGGYVMLPLLNEFFVEQYGVLTHQEFVDAVAIGQLTPGPLTVMNAFIGYKVMGVTGAAVAAAGTYMPSLMVVSLLSRYYMRFKDSRTVDAVFRGIKPALVGMLGAVAVTLSGVSVAGAAAAAVGAASFAAVSFTRTDPTLVIIGAAIAGALFM